MAWSGVITNAGATLLASWGQSLATLIVKGAEVGNATDTEANLRVLTQVECDGIDPQEATLIKVRGSGTGTRFKIQVQAGETAYTAKMIGVYARLSTQSSSTPDTLMLVVQDSTGVAIPAASTDPDFVFSLYINSAIDNTGDLEITVDPAAFATIGDIEDAVEDLNLGDAATASVSNALNVTAGGSVLDARQGKALKDLIDAMCVQPGTYSLTYSGAGYITSAKSQLMLTVPIGKAISGVTPTAVSCSALEIRQNGNYLWKTSDGLSELEIVPNTAANPLRSGLGLNLYRSRGGAHVPISDDAINNEVAGVYLQITVTWAATS